MQKHEIENLTLTFTIGLPVLGWIAGAYISDVPLTPFPEAFTSALHMTSHSPWLGGGAITGLVLAAALLYLMHEYGDNGFRGAAYLRWLRGAHIDNWHTVKGQAQAANRKENADRRKEGQPELSPIMIGHMPVPIHLENRNVMICASTGA